MRLIVRNMVCPRCVQAVEKILQENQLKVLHVRLGEIELLEEPRPGQLDKLGNELLEAGFELLDDQKSQLIEQIKTLLIRKVQTGQVEDHFSISKFLKDQVYKDYSSISKLFSATEGITIEQFFILQKLEKVKEWLIYNERSLSQIAFDLGYSSTQHLSSQFRKLTGMTPTQFKQVGASHRKPLDGVRL